MNPALTALAVAGIGVLSLLWVRPVFAVVALIVILPLNDLIQYVTANGSTTSSTPFGALKDVLVAFLLARLVPSLGRSPRWLRTSVAIICALAAASAVFTPSLPQALYGFRNDIEPFLLLVIAPVAVPSRWTRRVVTFAIIMGEVSAAIAIGTWSRGVSWLLSLHILPVPAGQPFPTSLFTTGDARPRAFSPYASANDLGQVLAMIFAVIVFRRDWSWKRRLVLCVLPIMGIYLSRSRSGEVGAALVVLVVVAYGTRTARRPQRYLILVTGCVALLAALAVLLLTGSQEVANSSTTGHADSALSALGAIPTHPFGYGIGTVGPRAARYTASPVLVESSLLLVALEIGVVGAAVFVLLLVRTGRLLLRGMARADDDIAMFSAIGFGVLIASGIPLLVLPVIQEVSVMDQVWLLVGIGLGAALRPADGGIVIEPSDEPIHGGLESPAPLLRPGWATSWSGHERLGET